MRNGRLVEVKLHGDKWRWYLGKVIKARKMWVEMRNYPYGPFIADENSIKAWRYLRTGRSRRRSSTS